MLITLCNVSFHAKYFKYLDYDIYDGVDAKTEFIRFCFIFN